MTSVRVLVVDDSAYLRRAVTEMLSSDARLLVVGFARSGREALERVSELRPDVVTLDLMMPELDGLGFLREQTARYPLPVVLVSSMDQNCSEVLEALDAGAVDFVQKPTALASGRVFDMRLALVDKVLAAAQVPGSRIGRLDLSVLSGAWRSAARRNVDAVVVGVSTGGPQALRALVPQLPMDLPVPMALVLHMPVGYTAALAEKLHERSAIDVREAEEGMAMRAGRLIIAQAGHHLKLRRTDGVVTSRLDLTPEGTPHRPAVDVLFRSAAEVYGRRLLAVVLTGMGNDGTEGAGWVKACGGLVYAESETTALVYGMPRAVAEAGLVDRVVPLHQMGDAILSQL